MRRSGLVLVWSFAAAGSLAAASPNPDHLAVPPAVQEKARQLVLQLGSEEFEEREAASEQLAGLGRLARPALLAGALTSPDPEVRARCNDLLPRATALDVRARLDTFIADADGRYEHDLPGWRAFHAVACDRWSFCGYTLWSDRSLEKPARRVFAVLFSTPAYRRLISAVDGPPGALTDAATALRLELAPPRFPRGQSVEVRDPTAAEVAVLLFAESQIPKRIPPLRSSVTTLIRRSGFTDAARADDDTGKVYRAVAAAWLDSVCDPREMSSSLTLASSLDLPGPGCRLAARLLGTPGVSASYRGRGAATLVESGGREHIPLLKRAVGDEAVVYTLRLTVENDGQSEAAAFDIQARDLALAVGVLLSGQKLADYGFTDRYSDRPPTENFAYSYTRYYFADDAARKKAFATWAEWQKANPDG